MRVSIRYLGGAKDGTVDRFEGSKRLAIGSEDSQADVRLPTIPELPVIPKEAEEYAEICFDGKCYLIRTKPGSPTTRVNGEEVESVTLANGDVIEFGNGGPKIEFKYEIVVPDEILAPKQFRFYKRFLRMRAVFTVVALGVVAYLVFATVHLFRQEESVRNRFDEVERSREALIADYLSRFEARQQQDLSRLFEEEAGRNRVEADRLRKGILQESESRLEERLADLSKALAAEDQTEIDELNREIEGLRAELGRNAPVSRVFQTILERNDASVLLLYTEFEAVVRTPAGEARRKSFGWGTGFFVSDQGHIVTNKHVVQPWKFDPQFAALEALGLASVDEASVRIAAWPGGSQAFNEKEEPDFEKGFNTHELGNLAVLKTAPDEIEETEINLPDGTVLRAKLHKPDNHDVAVLQATGDGPFPPVTVKRDTSYPNVKKLDPVMVIGFPRGRGILEGRVAETSPSTGVVRKVEDTIYVTASIIPGNSGGPLFTLDGEVIGICTRVYSETLGICIRIEHAMALLE